MERTLEDMEHWARAQADDFLVCGRCYARASKHASNGKCLFGAGLFRMLTCRKCGKGFTNRADDDSPSFWSGVNTHYECSHACNGWEL